MPRTLTLCLAVLLALPGCSSMKPEEFDGTSPRFILEEYFSGNVQAWGVFQDRFGRLRRQFTVDIEGSWDGEVLTLVEDFVYDDGEIDRRVWSIRRIDEHTYQGTADDVVGTATGISYGNALNWQYDFDLQVGDSTLRVHFDDWMFLQDDEVMINRAEVTKWGFAVGEASIFFRRTGDPQAADIRLPAALAAAE